MATLSATAFEHRASATETYPINPPPTKMRLRRPSHKRPQRNPNNTRHPKYRHGNTSFFSTLPDISQSPRHNVNANRTRTTPKKSRNNQSREIRRRRRRDEPDEEQDVAGEVARHAADVLGQRHEEQREDCCAYVPGGGGPVEPGEVGLADVEFGGHLGVAGAVGAGGEAG
jgi:hypothetical protein